MDETTLNVPAAIPYQFDHGSGDGGFNLVATPTTATSRVKYMDFKKGDWLLGPEQETVPPGTQYVVHAVTEGWVRLVKGETPQRIPRVPGERFPARGELGDTDQSLWQMFDGKPSDPWTLQNELLLTSHETGQPVIYRAKYWSSREVVSDLCRLVTYQQRARGDSARPIVAIGAANRQSPKGFYKVPTFSITGWVGGEVVPEPESSQLAKDVSERLQARSVLKGTETTTAPPPPRSRRKKVVPAPWENDSDLDDEIPL